jgi:cellulose biosynthesis protein BcsQ
MNNPNEQSKSLSVPVISFFGTKGGVGKTTIMDKFATLISRSKSRPNVLLVDFDVDHRGLSVLLMGNALQHYTTIHEYLAKPDTSFQEAYDATPTNDATVHGKKYLIPSSTLAAKNVWHDVANFPIDRIKGRICDIFSTAIEKYKIDVVLIDCGPIINPLTASAAYLSSPAFIIGQNEPISFQSLMNYTGRIQEFFPDFGGKVNVILNKVRGSVGYKESVYAKIPFMMEVVDFAEGLPNIDDIRLVYLDYCVFEILSRLFEKNLKLLPGAETVFTSKQQQAVDNMNDILKTKRYLFFKWLRLSTLLGILLIIGGILAPTKSAEMAGFAVEHWVKTAAIAAGLVLTVLGTYVHFFKLRVWNGLLKLKQQHDYKGMLELLTSVKGRRRFAMIYTMSDTN